MDTMPDNDKKVLLDDEKKKRLQETLGINVDSDLFDPRYDYVFKRIFTADNEESKYALIDFLNSVLRFEGDAVITDLTVINAEIPVDSKDYKKSVFDLRVSFKGGEQALVEMELRPKDDFRKRSQFLISKAYSNQKIAGFKYKDLKKCYIVCITNFTLLQDRDAFFTDYVYRDSKGLPLSDDLTIVFLELSKIQHLLDKKTDELTNVEMWAIFLRYASDKDKRGILHKILEREDGVKMATQILEEISKDEKERMLYESQLLYEADSEAELRYAHRIGMEKGKIETVIGMIEMISIPLSGAMKAAKLSDEHKPELIRILKDRNIPYVE